MLLINCPRCETKNPLHNINCDKCGFSDVAKTKIIDKGILKPLLFSLLSIVIFPINVITGIGFILIILMAFINAWFLKIFGIIFPIITIGKFFDYFADISWGDLGGVFITSLISILIYEFVLFAYKENESLPYKILRFIFMFLFPPLLTFLNLYYYEPRRVLASFSKQMKNNLTNEITETVAKQELMEKYKKRDDVLIDGAVIISGVEKEEYYSSFEDDNCYKYFSNDSDFIVYLAYGVVILSYILYFLLK